MHVGEPRHEIRPVPINAPRPAWDARVAGRADPDDAFARNDHRMIRERGVAVHREHGHTLDRERVLGHPRWRVLRAKLARRAASTGDRND